MISDTTRRVPLPLELELSRVLAIGRGLTTDALVAAVEPLAAGGIAAFEVTLDSPAALESVAALREVATGRLLVGAGTVITPDDAEAALEAGAQFLVAPGFDLGVVEAALDAAVPVFPGAMTPTEIAAAWAAGATAVKLFPAGQLGPAYLKAVLAPLAGVPIVATGGVDADNARTFRDAGAYAVAAGGGLLADLDPGILEQRARKLVAAARGAVPG